MTRQNFVTTDRLRLEIETDPSGLTNLLQNPSGVLGGWAWVTPLASSSMAGESGTQLSYSRTVSGASYFTSEYLPIAAGQYAAGSIQQASASNAYHRIRFEWFNSSKVLLSSSTQTALTAPSASASAYISTTVAPASTAYMKIRIDLYTSGGANPTGSHVFKFKNATVAKSATAGDLGTVRTNLIPNPSIENASIGGWANYNHTTLARVTSPVGQSGSACLRVTATSAAAPMTIRDTSDIAVTAGSDYVFSCYVRAATTGRAARAWIIWTNFVDPAVVSYGSAVSDTTGAWTRISVAATAPLLGSGMVAIPVVEWTGQANSEQHYADAFLLEKASTLGTYFDGASGASGTITHAWLGAAHASASTESDTNLAFVPVPYINVLGPTHEISVIREDLNVGILAATILDATLDPSVSTTIRPGRRCRLTALDNVTGIWEPIFTGRVQKASVTYDPMDQSNSRARIELTATDSVTALASQGRSEGVGTISALPYVLEGCGVPWSVNGSGNQVSSATVVASNDNASALDQIAVTRDSVLGYAWVDRYGTLQAWDTGSGFTSRIRGGPGSVGPALFETELTDLDVSFSTDDLINEVLIRYLRFNALTGETEEVPFGPYRDETSISTWGVSRAEFTVQGITEASVPTYAASILTANATPEVKMNSATVAITDASAFSVASGEYLFADLYDYAYVDPSGVTGFTDFEGRVTRVEHRITPTKWLLTLGFGREGAVASPTLSPSPTPSGVTEGVWITPTLVNSWTNFGGSFAPARYMRKNGIVYLKGMISSGVIGNGAFTLPAGFRPAEDSLFTSINSAVTSNNASAGTAHTHNIAGTAARLRINSTGAVVPETGANTYVSLSGISFPAEA